MRIDLQSLDLDQLINKVLPEMASAAIEKTKAALKDALERPGEYQSTTPLLNLYEQGTSVTAQEAIEQLENPTLLPCVVLERAPRLIMRLSALNNPLQKQYEDDLKEYNTTKEEYTKKGSLYYKLLHEIGIDISSQMKTIDPCPGTDYRAAKLKLEENTNILTSNSTLLSIANQKVKELATPIALLKWPTSTNDIGSFVSTKDEDSTLAQAGSLLKDSESFDAFKKHLSKLTKAALSKTEAALEAANKRSGKDQNNALLSNLYIGGEKISVREALTQLQSAKPSEVLQCAYEIINVLTSIANETLPVAKANLKTSMDLLLQLTGKGSAYRRAQAAKIPDLPSEKLGLESEDSRIILQNTWNNLIEKETDISSFLEMIKQYNHLNNLLPEAEIKKHMCQKITPIATKIAGEIAKATGEGNHKLDQGFGTKSLDELIQAIPQIITTTLTTIEKSIETLKKEKNINYGEKPSMFVRDGYGSHSIPNINDKIKELRGATTYDKLEEACNLVTVFNNHVNPL